MHELERVIDALLHDVRGPLGVVGGYLRLLRQGTLSDPAQTERAITKAQDALRHVADLCAEAGGWLPRATDAGPTLVGVPEFADAIAAAANGLEIDRSGVAAAGRVQLALPTDRVAGAVIALMRVAKRVGTDTVRVRSDGASLSIAADGPSAALDATLPFDPWQHPGLTTALSCFIVRTAGGVCVAEAADPSRPRVRFDLAA